MWHEALEEASRMYFGEHNIEGMLAVLEPLHAMLERGAETLKEIAFIQVVSSPELYVPAPIIQYLDINPFLLPNIWVAFHEIHCILTSRFVLNSRSFGALTIKLVKLNF